MSLIQDAYPNENRGVFYLSHLGSYGVYFVESEPSTKPATPPPPPQEALDLKAELGMPKDAIWRRLFAKGGVFGEQWRDYDVVFFGILVNDSERLNASCPIWRISTRSGKVNETIQLWYQKVTHRESPVSCEIRWHPEKGEAITFTGLENVKREREITLGWRGKALLRKAAKLGRSADSSNLTKAEFEERAPRAYRKWVDRFGGEPTDVQLAEELGVSRATLYRYLKNYDIKINQIRAKATDI
jgi:hypothetical protein